MPDYEIIVRTRLEGDALRRAHNDLNRLNGEVGKSIPANDAAAAATTKHTHSHRELHVAAHALVGKFPHLTAIMWAFRSPLVAGALAVGLFIEKCTALFEIWKKLEDSGADLSTKLTLFEGALKNPLDALRQTTTAARELKEALDEVTKAALDPAKKLGEAEKGIDKQLERQKEVLKLRKEKVFAKIDRDVAGGLISEAEGAKRKARAGAFFTAEEARITDEAQGKKINLQAKEHFAAQRDFKGAMDVHEQAVSDATEAKRRLAAFEKLEKTPGLGAEGRQAQDAELAEKEKAAMKEEAEAVEEAVRVRGTFMQGIREREAEEARSKLDEIRNERKRLAGVGESREQKHKALTEDVERATQFEKETATAAAKAKGRAEASRSAVIEGTKDRAASAGQSAITGPLETETDLIEAEIKEIQEGNKLHEKLLQEIEKNNRITREFLNRMH
jgi:hypothetical protein